MTFLWREPKFGLMKNFIFASVRKCVLQLRYNGSEITTILNEFNQSLEGKKQKICCHLSKKTSHQDISCSNSKQIRPKSLHHHACTCSVCNVLLAKTHCLNFLTLLKLPNEIKWTDISLSCKSRLCANHRLKSLINYH